MRCKMKSNYILGVLAFLCLLSFSAEAKHATQMTVAKDGSGDYDSIQAALNNTKSFPDKHITIFIKNGIYNEKIRVFPWNTNLTFEGENRDSVIITFDDYFKKINRGRNSTFHTYTMSVEANDFTAKNLTVINASGNVGQAIALSVSGDRCFFQNCKIIGNQDTLYCTGEHSRQYFLNCQIEGTTDYIFGNATAFFETCLLHSKANSYITAASTTAEREYGFVFDNCKITVAEGVEKVYLGRPWRKYAKTIFLNCKYGNHVTPGGWKAWSNKKKLTTVFYAEFTDEDTSKRVAWSKQLSKRQAKKYRKSKVFKGWKLPS